MSLRTLLLFPVVALCACGESPLRDVEARQRIRGGEGSAHSAVVALLSPSGSPYCTATLLSEELLLTAAHCARPDAGVSAGFGPDGRSPELMLGISETRVHPRWRGGTAHDLAVLRLSSPVTGRAAFAVDDAGLREEDVGRELVHVGYGATGPGFAGYGGQREGRWALRRLYALELESGGAGQTCPGDSGGPVFREDDGGVLRLVGVVSEGSSDCTGESFDVRLDVEGKALAVLSGSASAAPCDGDGVCNEIACPLDLDCEPDGAAATLPSVCAGGAVAPHPQRGGSFCSRSCGADAGSCRSGMDCGDAGLCLHARLPEVLPGARCEPNTFCLGVCIDDGEAVPLCAQRCAGIGSCPSGMLCASVGADSVCVPRPKLPVEPPIEELPAVVDAGEQVPKAEAPPRGCSAVPGPPLLLVALAAFARRSYGRRAC